MMNRISKRDWEALSAYIDGQLSQKERSRLESRLQSEPKLQSALEELRRMRVVLHSLPELRAPRNYTLTPQMVPVRQERRRAYPILSLASAMATILLVLVLIGDFFAPRQIAMAPVMETQVVEAPVEGPEFFVITPGVGGAAPPPQPSEKTLESEALPLPTPTPQATPAVPPYPAEEAAPEEPQAMMRELEASPSPGSQVEAYPVPEADDRVELLPTPESEIIPTAAVGRDLIFRILEIGLGIVALVTGLAAFLMRRGLGP